jgi:60 kDa SS-A/Ro ribonucleoprotein
MSPVSVETDALLLELQSNNAACQKHPTLNIASFFYILIERESNMNKKTPYSQTARQLNPNTPVPQSQPIPGKTMVQNAAGGYVFELDKWQRLDRFLILGSESGNYYIGPLKMTQDNAKNVAACIKEDGKRVVDVTVQISDSGRAAKNDPALFVLAMCAAADDIDTRQYALQSLQKVARTGTYLFHFVEYIDKMRGWSRGLRTAIGNWYTNRKIESLAVQLAKYQSRDGWSHRDVLRLAHPHPETEAQTLAFKWAVDRIKQQKDKDSKYFNMDAYEHDMSKLKELLPLIGAYEEVKATDNKKRIVELVQEFELPLELVPTEKRTKQVYDVIIPNLGITALIRQLPTLTNAGVLGEVGCDNTKYIVEQFTNPEVLKKGRVHPIQVLIAQATYGGGKSFRGTSTWSPVRKLVDALEDCFYLSFGAVEPTGKRILIGLDISGSMSMGSVIGSEQLRPCQVTAAMSMVTMRTEKDYVIKGFSTSFCDLGISPKQDLATVMAKVANQNYGGTDCSLPMIYAEQHKIPIDAFVVYTDNETWAGHVHPIQALKSYQQKMGIPARLISVATSATNGSIADDSAYTMNVVGFDASAPKIISDFIRG